MRDAENVRPILVGKKDAARADQGIARIRRTGSCGGFLHTLCKKMFCIACAFQLSQLNF
jgi:hypothetical protein